MTREEILAMQPGRELDALVAEKVMGWTRTTATDGVTEYWDNGTFCGGKWVEPVTGGFRLDDYSNTWNPSESISAAWEVLEKMKETNDCVTLAWGQDSWQCHVCLFLPMNDDYEFNSKESMYDSPSAPEAICKCALIATMTQEV